MTCSLSGALYQIRLLTDELSFQWVWLQIEMGVVSSSQLASSAVATLSPCPAFWLGEAREQGGGGGGGRRL